MKILWKSVEKMKITQRKKDKRTWSVTIEKSFRGFKFIKVMYVFFQKHPDNLRVQYSVKEFLSTLRGAFQHVYTFTVHKSIRGVTC